MTELHQIVCDGRWDAIVTSTLRTPSDAAPVNPCRAIDVGRPCLPGERPAIRVWPSGIKLDLLDPNPDAIQIEDIAWSLSHICRWGGHINRRTTYQVSYHSVLVAHEVKPLGAKLPALLHDATETYLGDVISPLKHSLGMSEYRGLEDLWNERIMSRFGVLDAWNLHKDEIKRADKVLLERERAALKSEFGSETYKIWQPAELTHFEAETLFLEHFRAYGNEDLFPQDR